MLKIGDKVSHPDFGEGMVVAGERNGYVRVFFGGGERLIAQESLSLAQSWETRLFQGVQGSAARKQALRLCLEAHALPLMENATALTAAPIDLLPHQVVLTHRIATTSPRRFLIADEVGLGKTIETGLLLRELASRGELERALMIVPAGLVNNWAREMNEVFKLNFEVFGSQGDVTDRKSNAFVNHHRLIASIDTLKRPARLKRLLEAPRWDLIVFDEAHHLSAYRQGNKTRKTENYKFAEAIRAHSRDLILLSATPHQGDHFNFWMLVQLLNPALFRDLQDMVANRHRLNQVMFRRTKADACKPDGSPLFARRSVHTDAVVMSGEEGAFYQALQSYIADGFDLAKRQGKAQSLGFVMAIFQKIAASSFSAVRRTLTRRLISLTLHESLVKEQALDLDGRHRLLNEARHLIANEFAFADDVIGKSQIDALIADWKLKLVKKLAAEEWLDLEDYPANELRDAGGEEAVADLVAVALPAERERIKELLALFPVSRETKVVQLLKALGQLWQQNPTEKAVIFATYLGTVEMISREMDLAYPGKGVVVLRGGDHESKTAAEKKFKRPDGPRIIVCTAAGREGINLQHARVLFNFDLPWNPMDVEQRIGRIHRYKQMHTAQVYNIVLGDTIEGKIFLLLEKKLSTIAEAVGKLDADGNIAEDFRGQILGQLAERLAYDRLYREAVADPELKRTAVEIEAATLNATEARQVVFELFQDLNSFSLDEYQPFTDVQPALNRMVDFISEAVRIDGFSIRPTGNTFTLADQAGVTQLVFTLDRESNREGTKTELLGLDHPLVQSHLQRWQRLRPEERGLSLASNDFAGVLVWLQLECVSKAGDKKVQIIHLGIDANGERSPKLERSLALIWDLAAKECETSSSSRHETWSAVIEPMLEREIKHRGLVDKGGSYSTKILGWVEFCRS